MTGRLVANGVQLDLTAGISFPFNYSIADFKEPQKRKRNYSRSVIVPGTVVNMDFFSSTYQLSLSTVAGTSIAGFNFDPTVRVPARYYNQYGELIFNGLLQLNRVKLSGEVYSFECTMFSDYTELYMALGDKKLSELGWSEYNHALNRTNVKNSWNTSVIVNGTPTSNFAVGLPQGFGYHYGLVDYGYTRPAPKTFRTGDLFPMVYLRECIIKCLQIAGITHDSSFMDSALFKKILIAYGGGEKLSISPTEITNRRTTFGGGLSSLITRNGLVTETSGTYTAAFIFNSVVRLIKNDVFTPTVTNDTYSQYNASTGIVTIERTGMYNLAVAQTITPSLNSGTMTYTQGSGSLSYLIRRNGAIIASPGIPSYAGGFPNLPISLNAELQLNAGDTLTIDLFISGNLTYLLTGDATTLEPLELTLTDSVNLSFDLTSQQSTLGDGDTVDLFRFVPDMKASDLFTDFVTMFNVYISDPDIDDIVTVEPLTDFYLPTNQFDDWTQLMDHDKDVEILPSSSVEGKRYVFKWAEDNDYDNKRYRDRFGIGYGDYAYQVESTWQQGDREYKVSLSQTIPTDQLTPLVVPRIISYDETTNVIKPYKGKPRIFIWNGLKAGGWRLSDNVISTYEDLTTYPSVHHFDNWQSPTFDLNWGLPEELQYITSVVTNKNLFTGYHRDFLLDITGRDSKILQAYFKLNGNMIAKMNFGKLKMINGVLFRLNEIKDFDDTVEESTFCELIKIVASNKPKTFLTLSTTTPAVKHPVVVSPIGAGGISASTGVLIGGLHDALATASKLIG